MDVADVMELPLYSTSVRLNQRPVTMKGMKAGEYLWPEKAMAEWIGSIAP